MSQLGSGIFHNEKVIMIVKVDSLNKPQLLSNEIIQDDISPRKWESIRNESQPGCSSCLEYHHDREIIIFDKPEFNIKKFENVINEDISRIVLSFLQISDLCILQLVSKTLSIWQLTTDDSYWKDYCLERFQFYAKATISYEYNFKQHLIEMIGEYMKQAFEQHDKLTRLIESFKSWEYAFALKQEILNYKLLKSSTSIHNYKIVLVGDEGVGKTSLLYTLTTKMFPFEYVPPFHTHDNFSINCLIDERACNLELYDTRGREDCFKEFDDRNRPFSYIGADMFIICYSCDSDSSLNRVSSKWIGELRKYYPKSPIILMNTKIDIREYPIKRRELLVKKNRKPITFEQGVLLAEKMGCFTFLEVGAKNDIGLIDLPQVIVKGINMWNDSSHKKRDKKSCLSQ